MYGIKPRNCTHASTVSSFPQDLTLKKFGTFFVDNSLRFAGSSPSKNDTVPLCRWLDFFKTISPTKFFSFAQDGSLRDVRFTSH